MTLDKAHALTRTPKRPFILGLFVFFCLAYALISVLGPTDEATLHKYHLTQLKVHLLSISIVVPFLAIWGSAYFGYLIFRRYAYLIRDTAEGPGFYQLARGLGLLAFSLPVNSLLSSLASQAIIHHNSATIPVTIIKNYASLLLPLLAFASASQGAEKLMNLVRRKQKLISSSTYVTLLMITVSTLFSWLMVVRPAENQRSASIYYLPNWLSLCTLAVPYIYTWYCGVRAAYFLGFYQRHVKGTIYKKSLWFLSAGIYVVVVINILIQVIVTLSGRFYKLHLTPLLLIVYLLLALYVVGFGLIASGAKKMKKIEEV